MMRPLAPTDRPNWDLVDLGISIQARHQGRTGNGALTVTIHERSLWEGLILQPKRLGM